MLITTLSAIGCGYGPEEPAGNTPRPQAARGPAAPQPEPTPPAAQPQPPTEHTTPPEKPSPRKPAERPESQPAPEPPGPEAVPYDVVYVPPDPGIISGYIGGALGAARRTRVMTALRSVNQWLQMYKTETGRLPRDMSELEALYRRDGGRFEEPPPHYKYFYWPRHGVVKMVRVDDARFRDPKGIHTRKGRN